MARPEQRSLGASWNPGTVRTPMQLSCNPFTPPRTYIIQFETLSDSVNLDLWKRRPDPKRPFKYRRGDAFVFCSHLVAVPLGSLSWRHGTRGYPRAPRPVGPDFR
jgi:hypothetical protein